ncbi:MAG: hypothetical protein KKB50_15720 [Planctomycetes bacterium]|nr:hypothetical protein [Planctomycetota bacterium]
MDRGARGASVRAAQRFEYDADSSLVNSFVAGDMSCDGVINGFDINGFMLALQDCDDYYTQYPNCNCLHSYTDPPAGNLRS